MAVTATTLKAQHPEFDNTTLTDAIITGAVARASLRCDQTVLGDQYDLAVEYYACHLLALSPHAVSMRLGGEQFRSSKSLYLDVYKEIISAAGAAYRTLGVG
jgi:hypothetical protein